MIRNAFNSISTWLNKSDFRSQILRGGGISLFVQVAFAGLSFVSATLLGQFLGASGYGEYANAQSWVSVLIPVATLGLNFLLVRNITIFVAQKRWNEYHGLSRFSTWVTLNCFFSSWTRLWKIRFLFSWVFSAYRRNHPNWHFLKSSKNQGSYQVYRLMSW